jgi:hypothetical protein
MVTDRASRNLCDDLVYASQQLRIWRLDGNADKISFWVNRTNELLDRWSEMHKP